MELMTIVSGLSVLVLIGGLWIWGKDGRSFKPFCDRFRKRIRLVLGVVSRDEMNVMKEHLRHMEQQLGNRLTRMEESTKISNQLQYISKEIDRRLTRLEKPENSTESSVSSRIQQPRSIVRLGLRLTLNDALWAHLGVRGIEEIEEQLIDTLIQGPFCPVCLKWLVGRDQAKHSAQVPAHCRHCGVSWEGQGALTLPLSLVELKRQVYDALDKEYRACGIIQPYKY